MLKAREAEAADEALAPMARRVYSLMYAKRFDSAVAQFGWRRWTGRRRPWAGPGLSTSGRCSKRTWLPARLSPNGLSVSRSRAATPWAAAVTMPPCAEPWRAGPMKKIADAGLPVDRADFSTYRKNRRQPVPCVFPD